MRLHALVILVLAVSALSGSLHAGDAPALAELLDRTGQYVTRFETEFRAVVSDEDYDQHLEGQLFVGQRERKTHSEMIFMWLPDQWSWLTVRNVSSVNGLPVSDADDGLRRLLADPTARLPTLRALRERGARFNIGSIQRTINDPNLALLFLDPVYQRRFTFKLNGRETINGATAWKVSYDEHQRPTVIQDGASGSDLFSHGSIWVSEIDSAVVRTELAVSLARGDTQASVTVDYARAPRFSIWLPARMREGYTQWDTRLGRVLEHVECVATYADFRRFETSGRVLPPK